MSLNNRKRGSRFGFTLIELLVVVAIIAVLISILLPSLSNARKQAKRLLCGTRMSELGKAALMYAHDNNDMIVRAEINGQTWGQDLHFAQTLLPGLGYDGSIFEMWGGANGSQVFFREVVSKFDVLQCPSFPDPEQDLDFVVSSFLMPYTRATYNRDNGRDSPPGDETREQNSSNVTQAFFNITKFPPPASPGDKIYITEAHATMPKNTFILHDVFFTSQLPFGAFPRIANDNRHLGQNNALFFDGHVESMSFKRMDAGWPKKHGFRLRWFTILERGEDF